MAERIVSKGYFTLWTGWTPLAVFRAGSMREERVIAESEDLLREVRRPKVAGKPLLGSGDKVWVGLSNSADRAVYDSAQSVTPTEEAVFVWLQEVDQ